MTRSEITEHNSQALDSPIESAVPLIVRQSKKDQRVPKGLFSPPSDGDPAEKLLPVMACAFKGDDSGGDDKKPSKDAEDDAETKKKIAELCDLVDKQKYRRSVDRGQAEWKRSRASTDERERHDNERKELPKKYPDVPFFNDITPREKWLTKEFPLLSGSARAEKDPERGKRWQEFCKLAATNTVDGNIAKQIAAFGSGCEGRMFTRGLDKCDKPSGLLGTGDDADAQRTWGELHSRLLRDLAAPGTGARDLTAHCVRDAFEVLNAGCKDGSPQLLVEALKRLTVADKEGAPLTKEQVTVILRDRLGMLTNYQNKWASEEFQLVLIKSLREMDDAGAIPLYQELQKKSTSEAVRREASQGLSDLGPFPRKQWEETIADPRLTPKERAERVRFALDYIKSERAGASIGTQIADVIVDCYKMPKGLSAIENGDDPGLEQLKRALDSEHLYVRMAASKVLAESKLDFDNPVRKKAAAVLADIALDENVGKKAKLEALALLDDSLIGHQLVEVGKYTIAKQKHNLFDRDALVVQDTNYQYLWTEDGKMERKDRESKISSGDKVATLKVGLNSISVNYIDESNVKSREGRFDAGELAEMRWTATNGKGKQEEFVAKRQKNDGKYGKKWTVTIPGEGDGLSKEVVVEGTFTFNTDGAFQYVGQDWNEPDSGRIVHSSQNVKDKGVTTYHNKP
jgi:hypothetical protein